MIPLSFYALIGCLSLVTGFLSGLLGIGGGIVMAPLLLYVPQLFGFAPLAMKTVAGLTIVQGLLSCIFGALTHRQFKFVSIKLATIMGLVIFIAATIGGKGSRYVSDHALLAIFGALALTAAILMLFPVEGDQETPNVETLSFSPFRASVTAAGVGALGGLVGQGGSFILIPLMIAYVKIPTRIAIGSNLAIVFFSSLGGFIGKATSGQIHWLYSIPIAATVIPATFAGSLVSRKTPVASLRKILAFLIALAAVRIWFNVFYG
jgi:hypothetical protein